MKISDLGEFGLIKKIKEQSKGRSPSTLIGIGDDAAALSLSHSKKLLATTDMLLEGVHFDLSYRSLLPWLEIRCCEPERHSRHGGVPPLPRSASHCLREQIKESL
jgi:hypothetical protein